ncbi:hypothetical protein HYX58_04165 [Candidatus Dependentiae bacterium]|nr:hypothetical protein [Candidatus Dependentiae bacterium]
MKKNLLFGAALASLVLVNVSNISAEVEVKSVDNTSVIARIKEVGSSVVAHVRSHPIKYGVGAALIAGVLVVYKIVSSQEEQTSDDMTKLAARN